MENILKMENFMGVAEDNGDILGKFLYFSLSNVLIDRQKLSEICENLNLPVQLGARMANADAFKSATGDIYDRIVKRVNGDIKISKVYCRDNSKAGNIISRELVEELLGEKTNRYSKLANLYYDKENDRFDYTTSSYGHDLDAYAYCRKAEELFTLYQHCAGRGQIENMTESYLKKMESLKIGVHGRLYFIPKRKMYELDVFEDFIEELNINNQRDGQLIVNSMFVIDDAKQRAKMTNEFYNAMRKEIEMYSEKVEAFIANGGTSPAIMERWALKINSLDEKKKHYEELLRHELSDLDDQYQTLKFMADELTVRARYGRNKKCA